MGNVLINESNLSAIASAIRQKNGQSTTYKPREMAPAILAIRGGSGDGVVWQDAEGYVHLAEDEAGTIILTSLSATANGTYSASYPNAYSQVTVNVGPARSAANLTASGSTVTVPSGYYSSQVTKNVASTTHPNPTAAIASSTGVVTATHTQTAGYVAAGTTTGTLNLTTQAAQTLYPSTADQTIASNRWLTGAQTIKSVVTSNLTAANIAEGVVVKVGDSANASRITQITGTHSGGAKHTATIVSAGAYNADYMICCVTYPMSSYTEHYTNGDSFTFSAGDTMRCQLQTYYESSSKTVYVNEEAVFTATSGRPAQYNYTLPDCDIEIALSTSGATIYITELFNPSSLSIIDCIVTTSKTGIIYGAIFDPNNDNMVGVNLATGSWSSSGMPFNILVNNPSTENPWRNLIEFLATSTCTITTNSSAEDLSSGDPTIIGNCYVYSIGIIGDNPTITIT